MTINQHQRRTRREPAETVVVAANASMTVRTVTNWLSVVASPLACGDEVAVGRSALWTRPIGHRGG